MIIVKHLNRRNYYRLISKFVYLFDWSSKNKFYSALEKYRALYSAYMKNKEDYSDYLVPMWKQNEQEIERNFLNNFNYSFLNNRIIRMAMFMDYGGEQQEYEIKYLEERLNKNTLSQLLKESPVGHPTLTDFDYKTSHNSIHHLCHLIKFSEKADVDLEKTNNIVEWGGGYGNLARIFLKINPSATYTIIDLPIFSFIQALYLTAVFGYEKVNLLLNTKDTIKPGKINIIPLDKKVLENMSFEQPDIFISTWALSESSKYSIRYVGDSSFFGARLLLLAHQQKSSSTPYSEMLTDFMRGYQILYHEKIPLLKNNYYLFARKNEQAL